jgi:hypothetical protein
MAATVQRPSKEAYAENRESFNTVRDKVYRHLVDCEAENVAQGTEILGITTRQLERDLGKENLSPRVNELQRTGLIVKNGRVKDGKKFVSSHRTATNAERGVLTEYELIGVPAHSVNVQMAILVSKEFYTKKGRRHLATLSSNEQAIYRGLLMEITKQSAMDLTFDEIRSYDGDLKRFRRDMCKTYLKKHRDTYENQKNKDKDDIGTTATERLLKYRKVSMKKAKR